MTIKKIIIDCDPGLDDAVALLLAIASPEQLEILGITTVAGNLPVSITERNARMICEIAGNKNIPVYAGCESPLIRKLITAEAVHGKSGLDGIEIFHPEISLQSQHAVDFILDSLQSANENTITLVATGPLTNLATVYQKNKALFSKVREVVLMGGALKEGGNVTPSAEFNIRVDPHAAQIVMDSGRPITVMGLDVSHQVLASKNRIEKINELGNRASETVVGLLSFYHQHDFSRFGSKGVPMHDPCTVSYLLKPELFTGKLCNLTVETESELTLGHTAVDFWHLTERTHNVTWMYKVDVEGFFELLFERLNRYR